MIDIPLKAKNDEEFTTLKKGEKEIIVYAVLCNVDNQTAFLRYNPHYAVSVGKTSPKYALSDLGKRECKNFWSYPKVHAYRESYENTLAEFLGKKPKNTSVDLGEDVSDADKAKALRAMYRYVIDNSIKIDDLEDPTILLKIADKMRFFDQLEDKQESPRRYLPVKCRLECQYRLFCEKAIENGEIENECLYCKALAIAQEHGYKYDPTTNLSIPQKDA